MTSIVPQFRTTTARFGALLCSTILLAPATFAAECANYYFVESLSAVGGLATTECIAAVPGELAFIGQANGEVAVIDVSDPADPQELAPIVVGVAVHDVVIDGGLLYVCAEGAQQIYDITTLPAVLLGSLATPGTTTKIDKRNDLLFVVEQSSGVYAVDVSNTQSPTVLGFIAISTGDEVFDVKARDNILFVAAESRLHVLDVTDPTQAQEIGGLDTPANAEIELAGDVIYLCPREVNSGVPRFVALDVSNPLVPVKTFDKPGTTIGVCTVGVRDGLAYVCNRNEVLVFDLTVPTQPAAIGRFPQPACSIAFDGDRLLLREADQLSVVDSPFNPVALGGGTRFDVFTRDAVYSNGVIYLIDDNSVQVFDLSDANNPEWVGQAINNEAQMRRALTVGNGVLLALSGRGLEVASAAPSAPNFLSHVPYAHSTEADCTVIGQYAYATSGQAPTTFHVIDLSNPLNPAIVNTVSQPGFARGIDSDGSLLLVGSSLFGLQIYDTSVDPTNPTLLNSNVQPGNVHQLVIDGSMLYTKGAGIFSVIDVSTPASPVVLGSFTIDTDTNQLATDGGAVYVNRNDGFDVFDVSDPVHPFHRGFVDVEPVFDPFSSARVLATDDAVYLAGRFVGPDIVVGGVLAYPPQCTDVTTTVDDEDSAPFADSRLLVATPNPMSSSTRVAFELTAASAPRLAVYDVRGRLVRLLHQQRPLNAGSHEIAWDGRDQLGHEVAGGVYFVRLDAAGTPRIRKVTILR